VILSDGHRWLRTHASDVALFGNDGDQPILVAQMPVTVDYLGRFAERMNDEMSVRFTVGKIQE
jgi:hypothetical protein